MKSSIATVSVSGSLAEKLTSIAERGYDAAEIFENDLLSAPQSAAEVGAMMRDLGLACSIFQPFRDYEGLPQDGYFRLLERMATHDNIRVLTGEIGKALPASLFATLLPELVTLREWLDAARD